MALDDPPDETFDLVHARLVLVHVPDRDRALRTMAEVLRPGGWLLVEDADPELQPLACPDARGPEHELAEKVRRGFRAVCDTVSTPAAPPRPGTPGPGRPKGSRNRHKAPRRDVGKHANKRWKRTKRRTKAKQTS